MRILSAAALVGLFVGGGAPLSAAADDGPDDGLDKAFAQCRTAAGDARIEGCSRFIELEKTDKGKLSTAHFYRGEALSGRKDHQRAIADFTRSNEYFPHPTNNYKRANEYLSLKRYEEAIADYSYTLERLLKHHAAYNNRGVAHWRLGQRERALADYEQAIKHDPHPALGHYNRAWAYLQWDKPALGLLEVDKALELTPKAPNVWHTRGRLLEALGRRQEAIEAYRATLRLDPSKQSSKDGLKRLGVSP